MEINVLSIKMQSHRLLD